MLLTQLSNDNDELVEDANVTAPRPATTTADDGLRDDDDDLDESLDLSVDASSIAIERDARVGPSVDLVGGGLEDGNNLDDDADHCLRRSAVSSSPASSVAPSNASTDGCNPTTDDTTPADNASSANTANTTDATIARVARRERLALCALAVFASSLLLSLGGMVVLAVGRSSGLGFGNNAFGLLGKGLDLVGSLGDDRLDLLSCVQRKMSTSRNRGTNVLRDYSRVTDWLPVVPLLPVFPLEPPSLMSSEG